LRGWILVAARPLQQELASQVLASPRSPLVPYLVLRNVRFAVVIPLGMTPGMAVAVLLEGTHGPMRIGRLPLHFSQFVDEIDGLHVGFGAVRENLGLVSL
jgi:hypothetical protein